MCIKDSMVAWLWSFKMLEIKKKLGPLLAQGPVRLHCWHRSKTGPEALSGLDGVPVSNPPELSVIKKKRMIVGIAQCF